MEQEHIHSALHCAPGRSPPGVGLYAGRTDTPQTSRKRGDKTYAGHTTEHGQPPKGCAGCNR